MTKERWIKGEEQLNKLNKATNVFSDDYKKEIKVKDEIIREMQCHVPRLWKINR